MQNIGMGSCVGPALLASSAISANRFSPTIAALGVRLTVLLVTVQGVDVGTDSEVLVTFPMSLDFGSTERPTKYTKKRPDTPM